MSAFILSSNQLVFAEKCVEQSVRNTNLFPSNQAYVKEDIYKKHFAAFTPALAFRMLSPGGCRDSALVDAHRFLPRVTAHAGVPRSLVTVAD